MKTTSARVTLVLWVVSATIALGHFLLIRPDLGPQIPQSVALRLVELYGARNGEELQDLETLIAFGSAFAVVLVLTVSGLLLWRRMGIRKAKP